MADYDTFKGRQINPLTDDRDELTDTFMGLQATSQRVFLVSYFTGIAAFLATLIMFNTVLYTHHNVVFWLSVVVAILCIRAIVLEKSLGSTLTSVWARSIGWSCLVALALGSIFGLFCYDTYGYFSFIYRNARTYQNTVPSEPAASVADAGRMIFALEAFVDQSHASGYFANNGVTYCVAPIRDMVKTTHVEFWAVGYDCCGWAGSFECDASADSEARGGIVVFDNPGIFTNSNRDYYDLARRKAEASYDLISAKKPLYVRWVKNDDLNLLQKFYGWRTAGFIIAFTAIYAAVSVTFVFFLSKAYYKSYFRLEE